MNLGENIYRLRTERNLSQGDFADALEVSRQSVSKWENNSAVPELDKLVKMAELFGITLDELVTGSAPTAVQREKPGSPALSVRTIIGIIFFCVGLLSSLACLLFVIELALIAPLLAAVGLVLIDPKLKHSVWAGCGVLGICYIIASYIGFMVDTGLIGVLVVWGLSTLIGYLFYRYVENHDDDTEEGENADAIG